MSRTLFTRTLLILWSGFGIALGIWFFLIPFGITSWYLGSDEGLRKPGGSDFAFACHRKLSKRYEKYASRRVESGIAASTKVWDIAGTEWPLFGSVFYLWSTVHLQDSYVQNPSLSKVAPNVYARDAIEAATNLVLDEAHATWVKTHWGEDKYLNTENVFYRMLVMWAVICHHRLTGSENHFDTLRYQAESLAAELDESPYGLLDDYPNQCYPTDVTAALAAIAGADTVLGTDHSDFLQRSIRGFEGAQAESLGLPPYAANSKTGVPFDASRGCANSYFCSFAPVVWPNRSAEWYDAYVKHSYQQNWFATGFREFPKGVGQEWYFDVDAGPVLGGFGSAASAFGVAAARSNGDFKTGYPLAAELLAYSWPLANGTLMLPRFVSDQKHAPHLGEAAILFQLSREPITPAAVAKAGESGGGSVPGCVWILLGVQLLIGTLFVFAGGRRLKRTLAGDQSSRSASSSTASRP